MPLDLPSHVWSLGTELLPVAWSEPQRNCLKGSTNTPLQSLTDIFHRRHDRTLVGPGSKVHMPRREAITFTGVFFRTNQTSDFVSQRANSAVNKIDGRLGLQLFDAFCLSSLILFVCFTVLQLALNPHYTLCDRGHSFPLNAAPTFAPSALRCST